MRATFPVLFAAAIVAAAWAAEERAEQAPLLLSSFEPGEPGWVKGDGTAVKAHATHGEFAREVANDGKGYAGIEINDPAPLRRFKGFVLLRIDIFNPHEAPVRFSCRMDDANSVDYGSRYNNDNCVAPPGQSTFELNLTGLTKSNARNFTQRDRLDVATLKLLRMFTCPGPPSVLYYDNVRLEGAGLPEVEGLRAFDFGPFMSPVYPGFTGCTDRMAYDAQRGFGWNGAQRAANVYMPDSLTGDYVCGREFRVDLPNGAYEVHLCLEPFGMWARYPSWEWRKVALNGTEVLSETVSGEQFLAGPYYAHEDHEDLPGQGLWEKYVAPRQIVRRYPTEVTGGALRIGLSGSNHYAHALLFAVVYPRAKEAEGRQWVATLERRRRERFEAGMVVHVPKPDGDPLVPTPADRTRGLIPFVRHPELDIAVSARPAQGERDAPVAMAAAQGEREHALLGLYPLRAIREARIAVSDLSGPNGATIPAAAVRIRKVRNFLKRSGGTRMGTLLPYILQDFTTLDLAPGVARGVWLTLVVPADAAPGDYTGRVTIAAESAAATVPLKLTVFPFQLDRATDITLSVTGSTAAPWRGWFPGLEKQWWEMAERVMKNQADHGMNAITGGPGARIVGVKDGKVEIDYSDMDRWLALAVQHGLDRPGDSYQGLDIANLPRDQGKDAVTKNEAVAREQFGVSYEELLKLVYSDVERHAKDKGWPKRVFYFLDEPRPEYRNVEPCAELIAIRTRACPGTLFSGYYSTGGGRDVYFETMPVSIAHINDTAMALVKKAGKQIWDYSGERVRHDIGRWAFVAARAGMTGFLRNGYMYVCSDPYFDFSDDEGSWAVVYPSRNGLGDTVGWERTAEGVDDYRYLLTCERLIQKARAEERGTQQADAAAAFVAATLKPIRIADKESAKLTPDGYDQFKRTLADHIVALSKALAGAAR